MIIRTTFEMLYKLADRIKKLYISILDLDTAQNNFGVKIYK